MPATPVHSRVEAASVVIHLDSHAAGVAGKRHRARHRSIVAGVAQRVAHGLQCGLGDRLCYLGRYLVLAGENDVGADRAGHDANPSGNVIQQCPGSNRAGHCRACAE